MLKSHDLCLSHASVSLCSEAAFVKHHSDRAASRHSINRNSADGAHSPPPESAPTQPARRAKPPSTAVTDYIRAALKNHPVRCALTGSLPESWTFVRLAREWGECIEKKVEDTAGALPVFAYAVLLQARAVLGLRPTPSRALAMLNKMALPAHGWLSGGSSAAQARGAVALTVLQPPHVFEVLQVMPEEQRVEFHAHIVFVARALLALWRDHEPPLRV